MNPRRATWLWWMVFVGLMGSCLMASDALAGERRFAVIVANNEGTDGDIPLLHAEKDARRLEETLLTYGDFNDEDVVVLLGRTADEILRSLSAIRQRMSAEQEAGGRVMFLLYYSGHADAQGLHVSGTLLPHEQIKSGVDRAPADMRIAIIDACRSGAMTRVKGGRPAKEFEVALTSPSREVGTVFITSSSSNEDSHESDRLGSSIFSHHLLNGLQGAADVSADGRVSLTEAYAYAYERTVVDTIQGLAVQHPTYSQEIKGRQEVLLTDLSKNNQNTGRLVVPPGGNCFIFQNESGRLLFEVGAVDKSRYLQLPSGPYWVRIRRSDHVLEGAIEVREGRATPILPDQLRRIDYAELVRKGSVEGRPAFAIHTSAGVRSVGELVEGWGGSVGPLVEVGVDLSQVSFGVEAFFASTNGQTADLAFDRNELGLTAVATSGFDLGDLYVGLGLRAGVTRYAFDYSTTGLAPLASSWRPSFGAGLRLDWSPFARALVTAGAGAVLVPLELEDRQNNVESSLRVAPSFDLMLGWYLW